MFFTVCRKKNCAIRGDLYLSFVKKVTATVTIKDAEGWKVTWWTWSLISTTAVCIAQFNVHQKYKQKFLTSCGCFWWHCVQQVWSSCFQDMTEIHLRKKNMNFISFVFFFLFIFCIFVFFSSKRCVSKGYTNTHKVVLTTQGERTNRRQEQLN